MNNKTRNMMKNAVIITLIMTMTVVFSTVGTFAASKPKKITITPTKYTLTVGQTKTIKVKKVTPSKASKAVYYKSSNKSVATVTTKGVVKAKKPGKATITVTSKKNKKVKAKCYITVKAKKVTPPPAPAETYNAVVVYFTHGENMVDAQNYYDSIKGSDETDVIGLDAMSSASIMVDEHGKLTGSTGVMATWIADKLNIKTVPIQVTDDYLYPQTKRDTQNKIRNGEHVTGQIPDIKPITEDLSQYDVVYLGFPNWDGVPPYALYTFIKEYGSQLEGKKIVPFTSYDNNKYVFSDAIEVLRAKLPKSAILGANDGLAIICRDFVTLQPQNKAQTQAWAKAIFSKAESTEVVIAEPEVDKQVKAQELIGKVVKQADIISVVGEYAKRSIDTNGCNKNVSSIRYFYPGFVIYAVPVNVNEAGEVASYITDPGQVTSDTYFLVRSVD